MPRPGASGGVSAGLRRPSGQAGARGPATPGAETCLPPLRVHLLGGFRLYRGERLVPDREWTRRKAKSLCKLLLLAPRHTLAREQAMELLWPEADPRAASRNLNTVLHALRRVLCPGPGCPESAYVTLHGDQLALDSERLAFVDVEAFERQALLAHPPPADRRARDDFAAVGASSEVAALERLLASG